MAYQFTQTGAELQDLIDRIYQIAEEYDPGTSYVIGDYCSSGGKVYRCTAATTGTFEPSKWTDSVIVMDAIKSLKGRMDTAEGDISSLSTALTQSQTWVMVSPTSSLFHCTGTITGSMGMAYTADRKLVILWGRIRITNFSRTGGNPGVTLSLPFTRDLSYPVGYRGESPVEQVNISLSSGNLTTTESYSNATGNILTLMVPAAIVPMI